MAFLQRQMNRGSISTGGYEIDNSLKFESDNSEYLYIHRDASGSDWNRLKWTASMWVKHIPTESSATSPKERMFGAADTQSDFDIRFRGQPIGFRNNSDEDGVAELRTTAVYRDYSAWYHIVAVWDTANSTAGNRMRLYVNGEEVTDFSTDTQPSQNEKSIWGKKNDGTDGNVAHTIGAYYNAFSGFAQGFNGYMAEVHWVEGEALAPTEFGEYDEDSGIWKPKEYTGTYGTNGFYLDFSNAGSLGADASGNGNNWSLNNLSAADQSTDTPTNNFCTLSPLHAYAANNGSPAISEGATKHNGSGDWGGTKGSMAVNTGKWYWEMRATSGNYSDIIFGIQSTDAAVSSGSAHNLLSTAGFYSSASFWIKDSTSGRDDVAASAITHTPGSSILYGIALNMDDGEITYYSNGSVISGLNGVNLDGLASLYVMPFTAFYNVGVSFNFGGYTTNTISSAASDANGYGNFEYAPPTGYYALCGKNLAEFGGTA